MKQMTMKAAKAKVETVKSLAKDDEAAHVAEDCLYLEFIGEIAQSKSRCRHVKIAQILLTTKDIDFARWCA